MSETFQERLLRADIELYKTRPDEHYEEMGEDGTPIFVTVEHYRQGTRRYKIIWRSNAEPIEEVDAAE